MINMIIVVHRAFISYADVDRDMVNVLQKKLKIQNINVFVADNDIQPSKNWSDEIYSEIQNTDIVLVLLTSKFHEREHTDQEVGIALGLKKIIMPLMVSDTKPHGFIKFIHGQSMSGEPTDDEIEDLGKSINKLLCPPVPSELVELFVSSSDFISANYNASILFKNPYFTDDQINTIAKAYVDNDQIRGGWESSAHCEKLFEDNFSILNEDNKKLLKRYN